MKLSLATTTLTLLSTSARAFQLSSSHTVLGRPNLTRRYILAGTESASDRVAKVFQGRPEENDASAQLSTTSLAASSNERNKDSININNSNNKPILSTLAALTILTTTLTTSFQTANAYEESDYASETVTTVVQQLKENAGDVDKTFGTLEEIAKIITEGKGVGGSLSYGELLHLCVCLLKCRAEVGLAVCLLSVLRGIATTHS